MSKVTRSVAGCVKLSKRLKYSRKVVFHYAFTSLTKIRNGFIFLIDQVVTLNKLFVSKDCKLLCNLKSHQLALKMTPICSNNQKTLQSHLQYFWRIIKLFCFGHCQKMSRLTGEKNFKTLYTLQTTSVSKTVISCLIMPTVPILSNYFSNCSKVAH